jgi:hypothetical protein
MLYVYLAYFYVLKRFIASENNTITSELLNFITLIILYKEET